ncbi:MAG: hypothetical protein MK411_11980 [SAR202 cluster bacterium]|nr:hypothetical protein [SAR202 cluster bacterium]
MPEEEKKSSTKLVDIDTSGPEVDVTVPEIKEEVVTETETHEETTKDSPITDDTPEKSDEPVDVRDSKDDKEPSETKQDEKLAEYSDSVKRRIAKLTKNWREAERQKDEAIHYAQSVEQKRKAWESKYAQLDSTYLKDSEPRIKSQLDAVKGKLAAAIESGDTAKQVEAQTELSALTGDARSIESEKIRRESYEPKTPATEPGLPAQTPTLPQVDEKAEDWATQNTWFGKDRAMTFTAFEHHKDLVEKEGFDPKSNDYYAEIDKRIRVDFPHKFGKTETTTKPAQTVASVRRSVKPGRTQVKLTSSQVAIAKKLGVPLEEYAKQLINVKEA